MELTVSQQQGRVPVTVIHVKGEVTADTHDALQTQAKQVIQDGARYIVLDLSQVPYVSSYGIRAISQIFTWLRDVSKDESEEVVNKGMKDGTYKSSHLKLVNPTARVLTILTTTGIDMFLEIHSDLKQTIASF
jgi:anti-anti-sigma factor